MAAQETPKLNQKLIPNLSNTGKTKNKTSEGKTSQNTCVESSPIAAEDEPSTWSQMNASSDVIGSAAKSAATPELRLATSDTATMTAAEIAILIA